MVAATTWVMPIQPGIVVDGFDPPVQNWDAGHRGVDLKATAGTWVRSPGPGTVSFVGTIAGKKVLVIAHGPLRTTYEPVTAVVNEGETVQAGTVVGVVAAAGGHCGGYLGCMHWGLRRGDQYLNPLSLVRKRPIVLKPRR